MRAEKKMRSGVALRLVSIEMRKNYVVWSWASERCLRHVYFCLKPPSCSERNERTSTEKFIAFFCVVQLEIHRRVSSRLMNDALLPAWMYFVYICNCFGKLRCFFVATSDERCICQRETRNCFRTVEHMWHTMLMPTQNTSTSRVSSPIGRQRTKTKHDTNRYWKDNNLACCIVPSHTIIDIVLQTKRACEWCFNFV